MSVVIANNAKSTLAAGIDQDATQLSVQNGDGSLFPALSGDLWFPLTLVKVDSSYEVVRATARSSDTITVVRGQEGTAKLDFSAGDKVELRLTAAVIAELNALADQNEADILEAKSDIGENASNITSLQNIIGSYGNIVSRDITISENEPSGGSDGDVWLQTE